MTRLSNILKRKANGRFSCLYVERPEIDTEKVVCELRTDGYLVTVLSKGSDVEPELTLRQYDILLMRIEMPDVGGIEVLKNLRRRKNKIPVILMTGNNNLKKRVAALNSGADDVVQTFLPLGELLARIRALLRRSQFFAPPLMSKVTRSQQASLDFLVHRLNQRLHGSGAAICEANESYVIIEASSKT